MRLRHKTTNFGVPDFNASKKLSVKELSKKTITFFFRRKKTFQADATHMCEKFPLV